MRNFKQNLVRDEKEWDSQYIRSHLISFKCWLAHLAQIWALEIRARLMKNFEKNLVEDEKE